MENKGPLEIWTCESYNIHCRLIRKKDNLGLYPRQIWKLNQNKLDFKIKMNIISGEPGDEMPRSSGEGRIINNPHMFEVAFFKWSGSSKKNGESWEVNPSKNVTVQIFLLGGICYTMDM